MESFCNFEYFSREKKYPDWNYQENGEKWPIEIRKKHLNYLNKNYKND
jgi:hypothetical protein